MEIEINQITVSAWTYIKDLLGPAVAFYGIIKTVPLIKSKLIESHVTQKLNEIQEYNSRVYLSNLKIIEENLAFLNSSKAPADRVQFKKLLSDIQQVYFESTRACGEVHTLLCYLNIVLHKIDNAIDNGYEKEVSIKSDIGFAFNVLNSANFYSTLVVPVPKSTKLENRKMLKDPVHEFLTHGDYSRYKYFNVSLIMDPKSTQFLIFTGKAINSKLPLLMRASYQLHRKPHAILVLLYKEELYAPYKLQMPEFSIFSEEKFVDLYLIGFKYQSEIDFVADREEKNVELIYSYLGDTVPLKSVLNFEKNKMHFYDPVLKYSTFDICQGNFDEKGVGQQYFKIVFRKSYLHQLFRYNKVQMKKLIKE